MNFAPVDLCIIRRATITALIMRRVAKNAGLSIVDLNILLSIAALMPDKLKGIRIGDLIRLKIKAQAAVYSSVWVLEGLNLIERRKRVKTAPYTIYITESGFEVLHHYLNALKRAEREKLGPKPGTEAQAKGGRISRKVKK